MLIWFINHDKVNTDFCQFYDKQFPTWSELQNHLCSHIREGPLDTGEKITFVISHKVQNKETCCYLFGHVSAVHIESCQQSTKTHQRHRVRKESIVCFATCSSKSGGNCRDTFLLTYPRTAILVLNGKKKSSTFDTLLNSNTNEYANQSYYLNYSNEIGRSYNFRVQISIPSSCYILFLIDAIQVQYPDPAITASSEPIKDKNVSNYYHIFRDAPKSNCFVI